MLSTSPSRQNFWHRFKLTKTLTPLTMGVALLTALGIAMETKPSLAQSQHYDGYTYRRTISIPRRVRSTYSYPAPRSSYPYDRYDRVVDHDHHHHSGSSHSHSHHHQVRTRNHPYSGGPYHYDRYNRVVDHGYHRGNSPYYYDRYNRVRRKFPHSPRYNRRRHGGSRLIFDSPGVTIRLGR